MKECMLTKIDCFQINDILVAKTVRNFFSVFQMSNKKIELILLVTLRSKAEAEL